MKEDELHSVIPIRSALTCQRFSWQKPVTGLPELDPNNNNSPFATDPAGRPIPPSLFCTDITNDPLSTAGDWQKNGRAIGPHFLSGTWKSAVLRIDQTVSPNTRSITTDADPAKNGFTLGPTSDPVPPGVTTQGYVTEVKWNVNDILCGGLPLVPGNTYRMQVMVHDGDQNKSGGDVGEACAVVTIPK